MPSHRDREDGGTEAAEYRLWVAPEQARPVDGVDYDQLGSLSPMLSAVVLWTTRYIDAAVTRLRAQGYGIRDKYVVRLTPFKQRNVNFLGRHTFLVSAPREGVRPLPNPDTPGLDDDNGADED
ncbi:Tn3 family transposase [Streptomyces sp. NPDC057543]|uniref:Tn3 family transposase n=1 Tax=Streptomyces sp. NPDC057543 TaxID=3346163 RepID=UPI0036A58BEE